MRKNLLSLCLIALLGSPLLTLALQQSPALAQSVGKTYLSQANQMYLAHRYSEAANLFYQAIVKEKAGPSAWLYMAHCQYAMGMTKQSRATYEQIKKEFPRTAEGKTANMYLSRMDWVNPPAQPRSSTIASLSALPAASSNSLLQKITITKAIVGHPDVANGTVEQVKDNIQKIPASLQQTLLGGGIRFCITPTLIDRNPELAYQQGRGYEGSTWKRCPGMFSAPNVIICERTVNEVTNDVDEPETSAQINQTFFHEIGHALDHCLGGYSHSEEYRHAYYLDLARVPPDAAARLAYYMQKSSAGQEECCAELTCVALNGGSFHADELRSYFPLTLAVIKKKLGL